MTDTFYKDGLTANVIALRHTLAKALVDVSIAHKELEDGNFRAAVGAVVPIGPALQDAKALLDSIFILNRQMD
jgi:hypothetical protein